METRLHPDSEPADRPWSKLQAQGKGSSSRQPTFNPEQQTQNVKQGKQSESCFAVRATGILIDVRKHINWGAKCIQIMGESEDTMHKAVR